MVYIMAQIPHDVVIACMVIFCKIKWYKIEIILDYLVKWLLKWPEKHSTTTFWTRAIIHYLYQFGLGDHPASITESRLQLVIIPYFQFFFNL